MRKKFVTLTASLCSMLFFACTVTGCTSCSSAFNEKSDVSETISEETSRDETLTDFESDTVGFWCGEEAKATFTVEVCETAEKVELFNDNGLVGVMHDDGILGDECADDGIYTYVMDSTIDSNVGIVDYYVKSGDVTSNHFSTRNYLRPTEESISSIQTAVDTMNEIESKYSDEDGYVPYDQVSAVISEVAEYVEELFEEGTVIFYEIADDNVLVQFSNAFQLIYMPKVNGMASSGSDVEMTVITCEPFNKEFRNKTGITEGSEESWSTIADYVDDVADAIDDKFENYTFCEDYDDGEVTLDVIKSLSSNQIILWHGHGAYNDTLHAALGTGESKDLLEYLGIYIFDQSLQNDHKEMRVAFNSHNRIFISAEYIRYYCGILDNDLFYLSACHSGQDSTLADAFLEKGAAAVIGNTDTIKIEYTEKMLRATMNYMLDVNPETQNYYTLSEALSAAKSDLGVNQREYYTKLSVPILEPDDPLGDAAPIIFGGFNADNYRLAEIPAEHFGVLPELVKKHDEENSSDSENETTEAASKDEEKSTEIPTTESKVDNTKETTAPTEAETTAPAEAETTAPTEAETTAPAVIETTAPTVAETTESKSTSHPAPFEQQYWIIFKEGYRNGRVEASTIDSTLPSDQLFFVWNRSVELNDYSGSGTCNQYYLTDSGAWKSIGKYFRLTDYAITIIASNLDVYDQNGNLIYKAVSYDSVDLSSLK